jgi:hypothetical protein
MLLALRLRLTKIIHHKDKIISLFYLIFLIVGVFGVTLLARTITQLITKAQGIPANIVVDTSLSLGDLPRPWEALAQGGEEAKSMIGPAVAEVTNLGVKYIRIDHLYDYFNVVGGSKNGGMTYDFSRLDQAVSDILKTGARPLLSLSYMPQAIAASDIISEPSNWEDWSAVVKTTIEHYSGRQNMNLKDVYYEVWNEPDLETFGGWRSGRGKNYLNLYIYAEKGAKAATNVNPFKLGGPSTTGLYQAWIEGLLRLKANGVKVDFLSWHRYNKNVDSFIDDLNNLDNWLKKYPSFLSIERLITEWGPDSEKNPIYNTMNSAAFTVAIARQLLNRVDFGFAFEVKDGPSEARAGWGIITHENAGLKKKPRYYAFEFLKNIKGKRLALSGEGSWVTAFATKNGNTYQLLLVNYDASGSHLESVPTSFTNLENGRYSVKETYLLGQTTNQNLEVVNSTLQKTITLNPNSVLLLEITKVGQTFKFDQGKLGYPNDKSLILDEEAATHLKYPLNYDLSQGTIEFWIKPSWFGSDGFERRFFEITSSSAQKLIAIKRLEGFGNRLRFGLYENGNFKTSVSASTANWLPENWYHLAFVWSKNEGLKLFLDGSLIDQYQGKLDFTPTLQNQLSFFNSSSALDELRISKTTRNPQDYYSTQLAQDEATLFLKHFDGDINR